MHHIDWRALAWVEHQLRGNLHLDRHLSLFGVLTFLLISGIVVTHVAYKETGRVFLWRRASRVLPLMIVITAGVWVLMKFGLDVGDDHPDGVTAYDLLANIDFGAFFSSRPLFMLAVTWTLLVQLVFYAYVALTIRLLRRYAWLVPALGTVLCFVVATVAAARGNAATHEIASIAVYLPVLFLGQLVPLVRTKRVHPAVATVIGVADYLVVVWSDYLGLGIMRPVDAVPRTLVVVFAMVLLTMSVRNRLTTSTIVREWSRRTYAIYLVHCAVVYPLLRLLVPRIAPLPAVLVALAATAIVVEVLYRFVEMPIDRAVRRRRKPRPPASGGGRVSARAGERVAQHSGS